MKVGIDADNDRAVIGPLGSSPGGFALRQVQVNNVLERIPQLRASRPSKEIKTLALTTLPPNTPALLS